MGYEEELMMKVNREKNNYGVVDMAVDGTIDMGLEMLDGAMELEEACGEGIGDAVGEVLDGADDLGGLAIVGIIAGVVALFGGIVWICKRLSRKN